MDLERSGPIPHVLDNQGPRLHFGSHAFWLDRTVQTARSELRCFFRDFDPLHQREEEVFRALGYIDAQNLTPRIRANVLTAIPLMDEICPPSTQFSAYNKITAPKQLCLYPDWVHEHIPTHADLVYQFLTDWM